MTARTIKAVVDWEMSTLGDPLADLGLTLMYWADAADGDWRMINVGAAVTALPGFFTRAQLATRYAELTGRDISGIGYYMAFGCFKLAVVLEGIHARYLQGKTVGEGFDREGKAVPLLVARAHQMLDADPLAARSPAARCAQPAGPAGPRGERMRLWGPAPRSRRAPQVLMRPGAPLSPGLTKDDALPGQQVHTFCKGTSPAAKNYRRPGTSIIFVTDPPRSVTHPAVSAGLATAGGPCGAGPAARPGQ